MYTCIITQQRKFTFTVKKPKSELDQNAIILQTKKRIGGTRTSMKTDVRFAALKFAGGIERRNVSLTKMLSKVHSAHFAFCIY